MPLDEIGAGPPIGSVADSYDALSETTRGLYNAECVCGPGTAGCDDVDQLELDVSGDLGDRGLDDVGDGLWLGDHDHV